MRADALATCPAATPHAQHSLRPDGAGRQGGGGRQAGRGPRQAAALLAQEGADGRSFTCWGLEGGGSSTGEREAVQRVQGHLLERRVLRSQWSSRGAGRAGAVESCLQGGRPLKGGLKLASTTGRAAAA